VARNGSSTLDGMVVTQVFHLKTGTSRIVATKQGFTITIERTQPFPDGMDLRPDDTIDVSIAFDQKVKA
jgi:hypothetical protein